MAKRTTARTRRATAAAPGGTAKPGGRTGLTTGLGLAALALIAYSNSFSAGFPLDNKQLILSDARVHEMTADNLRLIAQHSYWWPYGESGLYRPLTTLTYLLNYAVLDFRDSPAGYHVFNLAIHTANILFVWILTRRLTADPFVGIGTAAIWAVVPLSTEAVTNIVGRADLLAGFGVLAGFYCYLEARERTGAVRTRALVLLGLATMVGVFSKESAVTLTGVILAFEFVWWSPVSRATLLRAAAPVGGPIVLMLLQRSIVLGGTKAEFPYTDNPIAGAGVLTGRLTALDVMGRYLQLLVWPRTLSADYSYAAIPLATGDAANWLRWTLVALVIAGTIALRRRQRSAFFFLLFAAVTFLPASNLLFATGTIMAERLMYLPSVGLVAAALTLLAAACRAPQRRLLPIMATAMIAVPFTWRTWTRNADWKDDVTLWSRTVEVVPASAKAHLALADALYEADPAHRSSGQVIGESDRSAALLETLPDALSSSRTWRQAAAYQLDKAEALRRAAGENAAPDEARGSYERALTLLQRSEAIANAATATGATVRQRADVQRLRAAAHLGLGDWQRAANEAIQARELEPLHPVGHRVLADALIAGRQASPAAVALAVGSLLTSDPALRTGLIDVYRAADARECALIAGESGVGINPQCPIVREHLCAASAEAIRLAERAGLRAPAERVRSTVAPLDCTSSSSPTTSPARKP